MKRSVYIETTIPSFYYEVRTEPAMIARRESTQRWWAEEGPNHDLFASAFVLGELQEGHYPGKDQAVRLLENVSLLEVVPEIEEIAGVYVARRLMPQRDMGDAYHLAIASYYGMHFLLTWNWRHLANANKVRHLQVVNAEIGLPVPVVTTPDLLLAEMEDESR
ncbi:MAG: type II toxin-antitoxin system VapC family toxin [Planctomycetota bacterium]